MGTQAVSTAQQTLSETFDIPDSFWGAVAQEASGFFGAQDIPRGQEKCSDYCTSFRLLAKETTFVSKHTSAVKYEWNKLGFHTKWRPFVSSVILCFDVPPTWKNEVVESVCRANSPSSLNDPYAPHVLLIEHVTRLFDTTLWGCRDVVRRLEKKRTSPEDPQPDYVGMHEIDRHTIHSTEMLA